ncbi:MAG TPA: hypothetical protein VFH90_03045 [Candidatus Limnocylindria bacterium]|nr:hypothetical protein [Candidatus Limnocylindria bacterium]
MQTLIAALIAILVLAGCAGEQASPSGAASASLTPSAAATPRPLFVQLTDAGCVTTPASIDDVSGDKTWKLQNRSAGLASFQLMRIEDGSFDDLSAFFRGTLVPEPSQPPEGLPFVEEELERVIVQSGDEGTLTDQPGPGLYGVACIVLDEHEDIVTVYLTGPFTVADGA